MQPDLGVENYYGVYVACAALTAALAAALNAAALAAAPSPDTGGGDVF